MRRRVGVIGYLVLSVTLVLSLATAWPARATAGGWSPTGSMAIGRDHHTATLLPDGRVLVAGGEKNIFILLASAEIYDPGSGTWSPTGSMATGRYEHTATLLPDGRVLVAGGYGDPGPLASAEIYDPGSGTWSPTGSMVGARHGHAATLLPDGRVMVAGGYGVHYLASAEIYDPGSGTWSPTGNMAMARYEHTATLLPDGRVLVAGGFSNRVTRSSAEIYDPDSGTWSSTGSMARTRYEHTATLLPDGRVLVAGGGVANSSPDIVRASAEIYDPGSGTWSRTGSMATARYKHTATLLPDGQVLVAGGFGDSPDHDHDLASAEVFRPASGTWTLVGHMARGRFLHTATLLPAGRVLVAAGFDTRSTTVMTSAEIYAPAAGT